VTFLEHVGFFAYEHPAATGLTIAAIGAFLFAWFKDKALAFLKEDAFGLIKGQYEKCLEIRGQGPFYLAFVKWMDSEDNTIMWRREVYDGDTTWEHIPDPEGLGPGRQALNIEIRFGAGSKFLCKYMNRPVMVSFGKTEEGKQVYRRFYITSFFHSMEELAEFVNKISQYHTEEKEDENEISVYRMSATRGWEHQYVRKKPLGSLILKPDVLEEIEDSVSQFRANRDKYVRAGAPYRMGVLLYGQPGNGKANSLESKLLTPDGWVRMGDIKVGDEVIGKNGKPTRVVGVFPQGEKAIYRVTMSDGSSTECCAEHLWSTQSSNERKNTKTWSVRTTQEIASSLRTDKDQRRNYSIPMVEPVEFSEKDLPIDPYVMGALLGDGSRRLLTSGCMLSRQSTTNDFNVINIGGYRKLCKKVRGPEGNVFNSANEAALAFGMSTSHIQQSASFAYVDREEQSTNHVKDWVIRLGLDGLKSEQKFIPDIYLRGSVEQRIELLRGLMDTDGEVSKAGTTCRYGTSSVRLRDGVVELIQSLGGTAKYRTVDKRYRYKGELKTGLPHFDICVCLPPEIMPFRLQRKADRVIPKTKYAPIRYIDKVEYVGMEQAQCIKVAAEDELYVADDHIVTHNTSLVTYLASKYEMPIYQIPIGSKMLDDEKLDVLISSVNWNSIVLLEDIDAADCTHDRELSDRPKTGGGLFDGVTLTGLLNILDGVGSREGVIFIMTSNHPQKLDAALTRDGRTDVKIFIDNATQEQARLMFLKFFPGEEEAASDFAVLFEDGEESMASIQGHLIQNWNIGAEKAVSEAKSKFEANGTIRDLIHGFEIKSALEDKRKLETVEGGAGDEDENCDDAVPFEPFPHEQAITNLMIRAKSRMPPGNFEDIATAMTLDEQELLRKLLDEESVWYEDRGIITKVVCDDD